MELMQALTNRYSTKEFDQIKKISDEDIETIKNLLQLAPSSTNVQPWHFIVASTEEGKKRVATAAQGDFSFNEPKLLNASAVVVFSTKSEISEDYLHHVTEKEDQDGRFAEEKHKQGTHAVRKMFVDLHKYDLKDLQQWSEKQVYLNVGSFLLGVAELGIDAVPMEGLDLKALDNEFDLREKGFTSCVVVALGYRSSTDFNATLPKSRLNQSEIIEEV
ncbi:oxygen-insensitive NAD(P)H-dependent nitroreductase NfsB [Guptibacillus hwajinpoensis]|uniref:Dihydropteridine reductase n=1 Tax=Guptibacillus hwajinpoensis TaxID=208199 RepID=A0A0J6CXT6_9BACL|nr:oxygen-insensitive NAD(P)H-dependent nitroreductase NfsB [Alkalihalobacillus macyae]KMM37990.1 dihydropteridine reductase [Alkalihalobacillus macyae]